MGNGLDDDVLLQAAKAVARQRQVALGPICPVVAATLPVDQVKWAAWRRKEHLESISEADLDDQMAQVADIVDPAFQHEPTAPRAALSPQESERPRAPRGATRSVDVP